MYDIKKSMQVLRISLKIIKNAQAEKKKNTTEYDLLTADWVNTEVCTDEG